MMTESVLMVCLDAAVFLAGLPMCVLGAILILRAHAWDCT